MYVIHGSNDAIVPFYHGETLFQNLPDPTKTVPFWARGAGHNNIEMDMPTAYIKRLQQFVRQCDRLNYPSRMSPRKVQLQRRQEQQRQAVVQVQQQAQQQQMLLQASLQASLRQSVNRQQQQPASMLQQQQAGARRGTSIGPGISRYSSADSYHLMSALGDRCDNNGGNGGSSKPSKQRKQKGTLVIRSSHNHNAPPPPPPPPPMSQSLHNQPHRPRRNNNDSVQLALGRATRAGGPMSSGRNWIAAASGQQQQQQPDAARIQPQQMQQQPNQSAPQHPSQPQQQQMYAPNNNPVRYNQRPLMGSASGIPLSSSYHSHPLPSDANPQKYLQQQHQQQMQPLQEQAVVHLDYRQQEMRQ